MQRLYVLFCLALCLGTTLYGQENPSEQKPVAQNAPYSFMGFVPGESKADAIATLTNIWNAEIAKIPDKVRRQNKNAFALPLHCTAYTVSGMPVSGTELCDSTINLTVRELYYSTPNPIQIFYLTFVDGYLEAVEYDFLRTSFGEMVQALENKYGAAITVKHVTLANGFGAQFDCAEYTWDNGISSVTARQYNPLAEVAANSLLNDESIVKVRNKALYAEYLRRAAANGPKI